MTSRELASKVKKTPGFADLILSQIDDLVYVADQEHRLVFLNNTRQFP